MQEQHKDCEYYFTSDLEVKEIGLSSQSSVSRSSSQYRNGNKTKNHWDGMSRKKLGIAPRFDEEGIGRIGKRMRTQNSQICEDEIILPDLNTPYSTPSPTKLAKSHYSNLNAPEFILRKSALTFPNTPSIIRKRAPRNVGSSAIVSSTSSTDNSSIKNGYICNFQSTYKSLERRLEYAFQ